MTKIVALFLVLGFVGVPTETVAVGPGPNASGSSATSEFAESAEQPSREIARRKKKRRKKKKARTACYKKHRHYHVRR